MEEQTTTTKTNKVSNFFKSLALRLKLLWIWIIKNIAIFIEIAIIICVILIVCGFINSDTPILGWFFGELSENIRKAIDNANMNTLADVLCASFSILISAFFFIKKTKRIALDDIKSKELKINLIKANLYFNKDGKLCKRIENATKMDLNGDAKVGDVNIDSLPKENIISGIGRAANELKTILTAKIETTEDEDKVLEEAELNDTLDALSGKETTVIATNKVEEPEEPEIVEVKSALTTTDVATTEAVAAPTPVKEEAAVPVKKGNVVTRKLKTAWTATKTGTKSFFVAAGRKIKSFFTNIRDMFKALKDPKLEKPGKVKTEKTKKIEVAEVEAKDNVTIVETKIEAADSKKVEESKVVTATQPAAQKVEVTEKQQEATIVPTTHANKNAYKTSEKKISDILDSLK